MAMPTGGRQKVKKVICKIGMKSSVKRASVGCGENGAASLDVMTSASGMQEIKQGVCKEQARSSVQSLAVQVVPVQTRPIGVEREREGERNGCGTHLLNRGSWPSESEWLEAEVNSVSSITAAEVRPSLVGDFLESDGHDTPRVDKVCLARECAWIKDKKDHDKRTSEATGTTARYRKLCLDSWTKNTATSKQTKLRRCSDAGMT